MTADTSSTTPRISDARLAELIGLMRASDSVELKVSIGASAHRATVGRLPVDPVEAQPRQVYFFDTPDLDLDQAGIVVRARRIQGGRGDTVIKLRPVVPEELPAELRKSESFNVEVDIIPGGFVCSASFKGRADTGDIRDVVAGEMPLSKLYSKDQRAFFQDRAPAGIALDSLVTLGPTFVLKTQFTPEELNRKVVAEMWLYPDNTRVLELSTKCLPNEAFQVAAEARSYLASRGVDVGGEQVTKTRTALDFFRAEHKENAAAATKA